MLSYVTGGLDGPPPKTMRKGTHSCLECRQRKVRCVSEPHARKCNGCSLKRLPCTEQEPQRSRPPNSCEGDTFRGQFQKLEGMLDQVLRNQSRINEEFASRKRCRSAGNDSDPSGGFRLAPAEVSAIDIAEKASRKRRKVDVPDPTSPDANSPQTRDIGDEPFLKLFEDLDYHRTRDRNAQGSSRDGWTRSSTVDESAHGILLQLRLRIPNSEELISILQAGCDTIALWSEAFPEALGAPGSVSLERLRDHIYNSLYSDNLADTTKLVLCLALHIQQLPDDLETTYPNLPARLDDLQELYLNSAESLLSSDERLGVTLNGLECMVLLSEFYINTGNLNKVWLIIRRAVNLAQLIGLHRKIDADIETRLARRRNAIWTQLWQRERGFSLILGLPCSTLDSQISPSILDQDVSDIQKTKLFFRALGIVMKHVVERDQDTSDRPYSTTIDIEERLEECQSIMPANWWDFTPDSTTPVDAIRSIFVAKMRFYTVQRLLHLPFLLKASGDRRFEGSRLSTLKSSRDIISVYHVLRDEERPVLKMCAMADFQVFAAAMTLVIDLLIRSRTPEHYDLHREECDWQLVLATEEVLARLSRSRRGCRVAALGARVLEDFSQLRSGSAEGVLKVNIPYFGRIEIGRRDARQNEHSSYTNSSSQTDHEARNQTRSEGRFEDSVESMVSLDSYLFPPPATSQPADESWTSMLDLSMADDWSWYVGGDVQ